MFYDLNVPWAPNEPELQRTVAFLSERKVSPGNGGERALTVLVGYNVIALSHTLSGKLPADLTCPIPAIQPFPVPSNVRLLRRYTLVLSDPSQNHRIASLSSSCDILAIRPCNEKSLQQACQSLECDIISLDLTLRLSYYFRFTMLSQAIERGIKFEICYASGVMATDSAARRNVISNATQLIRATRGRGLVISSEAKRSVGCRGPFDVINLAAVWGLGQEKGHDAITKEARSAVVTAKMKRTSFRGVVDVVYGGERPDNMGKAERAKIESKKKRKPKDVPEREGVVSAEPRPISKREQKRQHKKPRLEVVQQPASTVAENGQGHAAAQTLPIEAPLQDP